MRLTPLQAGKLADYVKDRLPRSTDGQTNFLAKELEQFDERDIHRILNVCDQHVRERAEDERMVPTRIIERIRAVTVDGGVTLAAAAKASDEHMAAERAERAKVERDNAEALAFCRAMDPTERERKRVEVLAGNTFVAKHLAAKERAAGGRVATLDYAPLVFLIYDKFAGGGRRGPTPSNPQGAAA